MREITTLEGLIRFAIKNHAIDLHTSLPAIVHKSNTDGTVHVVPAIKRIKEDDSDFEVPVIPNVPIAFNSTAKYSITFPVEKGDEGLLIFCERDISQFITTGKTERPIVLRKHDYADAIFLPSKISDIDRPKPLPADGLELKDRIGNASIQLQGGNVNITGVLNINGVPYLLHAHTGVTTGPETSGPVASP